MCGLVPAQCQEKIFWLVNELAQGASFINDHDPKLLYYQLEAEYPRQFYWQYMKRGPYILRAESRLRLIGVLRPHLLRSFSQQI